MWKQEVRCSWGLCAGCVASTQQHRLSTRDRHDVLARGRHHRAEQRNNAHGQSAATVQGRMRTCGRKKKIENTIPDSSKPAPDSTHLARRRCQFRPRERSNSSRRTQSRQRWSSYIQIRRRNRSSYRFRRVGHVAAGLLRQFRLITHAGGRVTLTAVVVVTMMMMMMMVMAMMVTASGRAATMIATLRFAASAGRGGGRRAGRSPSRRTSYAFRIAGDLLSSGRGAVFSARGDIRARAFA